MKYNIYVGSDVQTRAFLCRGKAIDECSVCWADEEVLECSEQEMKDAKESGHPIEIMKAYYVSSTVSNTEQSISSLNYIGYRGAQFLCSEMETNWFTTEDRVVQEAHKQFPQEGQVFFVKLNLDLEMYEPAQFPMEVRLSYEKKRGSDKKSLCARINTHPEMDGKYSKGKIFFPDKSWKNPVEGPALVTSVKEMDSYGFICGESAKLPNVLAADVEEEFIMYLMDQVKSESFIVESTRLDIVHSPVRGEYLVGHIVVTSGRWRSTRTNDSYLTYLVKEGRYEFTWLTESWLADEVSNYSVRSLTVRDLVNEYVYKTYGSKESLKKRIQATGSSWFNAYRHSFDDRDREYIADNYISIDIPEYSELLDEFFDIGVLRAYGMRYAGVAFLEIDETQLGNLVYFTPEEVELMFEKIAAFNHASDREISCKLAKKELYTIHRRS